MLGWLVGTIAVGDLGCIDGVGGVAALRTRCGRALIVVLLDSLMFCHFGVSSC